MSIKIHVFKATDLTTLKESEFYLDNFSSPTKHDVVWGISMDAFLLNFAIIHLGISRKNKKNTLRF